jgi:hypothetical protein
LLHLRVVSPADLSADVLLILRGQPGAINLVHLPRVAMMIRIPEQRWSAR